MEINLDGLVVLVTGATSGIGAAIAEKLLELGAFVVINYHDNDKRAETMRKAICKYKNSFMFVKADVSKEEDVIVMYKTIISRAKRIDILINNAGITKDATIEKMEMKDWERVINTNYGGTVLCTKYVVEYMKKKGGKIINIASSQGIWGSKNQSNYAISKAEVIAFTKTIAKELGRYNIAVNALCPGYIQTEINRNNVYKFNRAMIKSVLSLESLMSDLVNMIVFLSSKEIKGISGQVFCVDSRIV